MRCVLFASMITRSTTFATFFRVNTNFIYFAFVHTGNTIPGVIAQCVAGVLFQNFVEARLVFRFFGGREAVGSQDDITNSLTG